MPLPGMPYPDPSPFNKSGTESRFAQKDYSEGMNQAGVDGDQNGAPTGMPSFANGRDGDDIVWHGGSEHLIANAGPVPPKAGAPGPM